MQLGRGRLGTLADTTTTTPSFFSQFTSGAEQWMSPSGAISTVEGVFSSPSTALSSGNLGTTLGALAVPALLLLLVMKMGKGRR